MLMHRRKISDIQSCFFEGFTQCVSNSMLKYLSIRRSYELRGRRPLLKKISAEEFPLNLLVLGWTVTLPTTQFGVHCAYFLLIHAILQLIFCKHQNTKLLHSTGEISPSKRVIDLYVCRKNGEMCIPNRHFSFTTYLINSCREATGINLSRGQIHFDVEKSRFFQQTLICMDDRLHKISF